MNFGFRIADCGFPIMTKVLHGFSIPKSEFRNPNFFNAPVAKHQKIS